MLSELVEQLDWSYSKSTDCIKVLEKEDQTTILAFNCWHNLELTI